LLEGFPWDARVALRVSGNGSRYGPKLRVLSCGDEEVYGVHGLFAWYTSQTIIHVFEQLKLFLRYVYLVSRAKFRELLEPPLFLLLHQRSYLVGALLI
jgi:hypothetical protein